MAPRWVYAAGNSWVPFNDAANYKIEEMFRYGGEGNVHVPGLSAYINTVRLYMWQPGLRRKICRTGC